MPEQALRRMRQAQQDPLWVKWGLIVARLQVFAYGVATAIAVVLLAFSFAMLVLINLLERWSKREAASA